MMISKKAFTPFPTLRTEHFILRQLSNGDENEIFILRSDAAVLKYLDIPQAKTIEDAKQLITKINEGITNNEWIYWVITDKRNLKLLGTICLWNISESPLKADIGFMLLPEHQGKGIMQEVIPVVLDYGFNTIKFHKINGEVAPENLKSVRLLMRFGFVYENGDERTSSYTLSDPCSIEHRTRNNA